MELLIIVIFLGAVVFLAIKAGRGRRKGPVLCSRCGGPVPETAAGPGNQE